METAKREYRFDFEVGDRMLSSRWKTQFREFLEFINGEVVFKAIEGGRYGYVIREREDDFFVTIAQYDRKFAEVVAFQHYKNAKDAALFVAEDLIAHAMEE